MAETCAGSAVIGARHARPAGHAEVLDELGQQAFGELLLQLERGLHEQPLAGVGEERRAREEPQPLTLDREQRDEVAAERLAGDVADRSRHRRRPAAGVEQRGRPDHPVERVARTVRLVQRPRDLAPVAVAEQADAQTRDEPEHDHGG